MYVWPVDLEDQIHSSFWAESIPGTPDDQRYSAGEVIVSNVAGGGIFDKRTVISSSSHPNLWTLHAWVHKKNPDGVFHPTNKTLSNAPRQ